MDREFADMVGISVVQVSEFRPEFILELGKRSSVALFTIRGNTSAADLESGVLHSTLDVRHEESVA